MPWSVLTQFFSALVGAVVGGCFVLWGTRITLNYQERRSGKADKRRQQRILSGLYVEVFTRAVRCARDAYTWTDEVRNEANRLTAAKGTPRQRIVLEVLKFEPSAPTVYPALAESHGALEPDTQAALSEFYYRLETVARDVHRFESMDWHKKLSTNDKKHFADVLYGTCAPAREAINQLRRELVSHADLDKKLNESFKSFFTDPKPLGTDIDEALDAVISRGRD